MWTIETEYFYEIEVNRSRFLAYLMPWQRFGGAQDRLRSEHPKANHVVYAFRYINEYDRIDEGFSDDREPRGSAGQPVLNVLRGAEIVDAGILIVRYFGGIKLGTGGMVRAYGDAAKAVIQAAHLFLYEKKYQWSIFAPYERQRAVEYHLEREGIEVLDREYSQKIRWILRGGKEGMDRFLQLARPMLSRVEMTES